MHKILIWFICGISSLSSQAQGFTTKDGTTITGDNYITQAMTFIPSDTPISQLAISASHDAATYSITDKYIAAAANTQYFSGTIPVQLHAGVRWFDLRVNLVGYYSLIGFHGDHNGSIFLNTDIQEITYFLQENPGEFVVLSLIDGNMSTPVVNELQSLLAASNPIIVTDPNQPPLTYAQVKGRVVITTVADNSLNQCVGYSSEYDPIMPENIGHELECIAKANATEAPAVVMHEIRADVRIPEIATPWANYYTNFAQMNPLPGNLDGQNNHSAIAQLGAMANAGIPAALYDLADAYKNESIEIGAVLHDAVVQDYDLYQYLYALMDYKYRSSNPTFSGALRDMGFPHKLLITYDSFCSPFNVNFASDQCYSDEGMHSVIFNSAGTVIKDGWSSLDDIAGSTIEFDDNGTPGNYIIIVPYERYGKSFGIVYNPAYHGKWASYFKSVDYQSITY